MRPWPAVTVVRIPVVDSASIHIRQSFIAAQKTRLSILLDNAMTGVSMKTLKAADSANLCQSAA